VGPRSLRRACASGLVCLFFAVSLSGCDPTLWIICGLGACDPDTDYFPPETPQDVVATPFSRGVEVSWRRSPDQSIRFQVLRTTTPGRHYVLLGQTAHASWNDYGGTAADDLSLGGNLERLENGRTYYYIVKAVDTDSGGDVIDESLPSVEVSATPQANIPPRPPSVVTASGGANYVDITWNSSFTAARYYVYRADSPTADFARIATQGADEFTFRDVGLSPGSYRYAISAENSEGAESGLSTIVAAGPTGTGFGWLASWGTQGTGPGQFESVWDVATDRQGRIYVLDSNAIQQFDVSRAFLRRYGESGEPCSGSIEVTGGIASDAAGNTYVADPYYNCVQKFAPDGTFTLAFGTEGTAPGQMQEPRDVAVDAEGTVYVLDAGNHRVQKFSPQGVFQTAWGEAGTGPGQLDNPTGIAVSRSGDVYVSEPVRVQRFDTSGDFVSGWGEQGSREGQFAYIQALAVSPQGEVYVADGNNHRVEHFTAAGVFIDQFGRRGTDAGEFMNPTGIDVDCAGKIYVADNNNFRVQKFGDTGSPDPPCGPISPGPRLASGARRGAHRFVARFSSSAGEPGAMAQRNNKLSETGALQRGRFRITAPGARRYALGRSLTALFRRGRWYALFDVDGDPLNRRGTAAGTLLTTAKKRRGGQLCLSFKVTLRVTRRKLDVRGTFRTLGGTRSAARLTGRGSYVQTRSRGQSWTIRGRTNAAQGTRRSLPVRCRAVKRAHGLR
jgi:NHL repeat